MRYVTFEICADDAASACRVASELRANMTPYQTSHVAVEGASIHVTLGFDGASEPAVVANYAAVKIRRVLGSAGCSQWPVTRHPAPRC